MTPDRKAPWPVNRDTMSRAYAIASRYYAQGMDRDDLTQEALIGALAARRDYRPDRGLFPTFEWHCMKLRVMEAVRTSRSPTRGNGESPARLTEHVPAFQTTENLAEIRAELRAITGRLFLLSPTERRMLTGLLNGRSYSQLGPHRQVSNALQRARRKLAA